MRVDCERESRFARLVFVFLSHLRQPARSRVRFALIESMPIDGASPGFFALIQHDDPRLPRAIVVETTRISE